MPCDWISDPPSPASGSKTPPLIVPKRVSTSSLPPPVAPTSWQPAHEVPLNTGPRPSAAPPDGREGRPPVAEARQLVGRQPGKGAPKSTGPERRPSRAEGEVLVVRRLVPRISEFARPCRTAQRQGHQEQQPSCTCSAARWPVPHGDWVFRWPSERQRWVSCARPCEHGDVSAVQRSRLAGHRRRPYTVCSRESPG